MTKQTDKELLSRLFDGDSDKVFPKEMNRDDWNTYAIIGDSMRGGSEFLAGDVSARVKKEIETTVLSKSAGQNLFERFGYRSIVSYLRNLFLSPKTGAYQFASVAIVFVLGFSSHNVVNSFKYDDVDNFYVESGIPSVAVLNSSEQIESDCDISEVFVDELIMIHQRLSGSSDIC